MNCDCLEKLRRVLEDTNFPETGTRAWILDALEQIKRDKERAMQEAEEWEATFKENEVQP